jgi:hypothetical protein
LFEMGLSSLLGRSQKSMLWLLWWFLLFGMMKYARPCRQSPAPPIASNKVSSRRISYCSSSL